jgi:hypothetical protein
LGIKGLVVVVDVRFRSLFRKFEACPGYINRGSAARLGREERTLEPAAGQGFLSLYPSL